MALKADRLIIEDDIRYTCDSVAERGVGLVHKTSGSGVAIGESAGVLELAANPSGAKFAGLLLNDMVDIDETRYRRNPHKDEMVIGERCRILKKGRVTTNKISGTPAVDDTAYLTTNGNFTPTVSSTGGTAATPKAGKFVSIKDEHGYATIEFNLPIV